METKVTYTFRSQIFIRKMSPVFFNVSWRWVGPINPNQPTINFSSSVLRGNCQCIKHLIYVLICLCYINERVLDSKYWSLKGHSPMQAGKGWCCKCSTPEHNSIWRVTVGVNFVAHSIQFSYSNSRTTQRKQEGTNIEKQVITKLISTTIQVMMNDAMLKSM